MAVKLIANYAKRLGLPGYSSHQFSVSVETELHGVEDVPGESARLYQQLQEAVDGQIQATGFVPPHEYGMNGNGNGQRQNGNGHGTREQQQNGNGTSDGWKCSPKQQELIEKIVAEHKLEKYDVEQLAQEMFSAGVKALNKLQASGLIEELIEKHGGKSGGGYRQQRQPYRRQRAGAE